MKIPRPLLAFFGIIALVGAVALGCALNPSFQRWVILGRLNARPGLKVEAGEVSVGFSSVILRGVQVEKRGLRVQLDHLEADYSLWQVLWSRRLLIHQLTAGGILVDSSRVARGSARAAAAGAPVVTPGLLGRIRLPFALVLDDCRVEGRALLPGAVGKPPVEAEYKITGGKFAPDQEGSLLLAATLRDPAADASVAALNAQVSLRATQSAQRAFSRVALTAVVDAEGRNLSEQNQLKISAALNRDAAGENYSVSVDTLTRNLAENLLAVRAVLPAGRQEYSGQWTLKARTAQLAPFALSVALPLFDVRGTGRFAFAPGTKAVDLQGDLQIDAGRLEVLDPAWRAIGAVKLQAQFDVAVADGVARLRQIALHLSGDQPVLELQAASAAEFNFTERRLHVGGLPVGSLLNLRLAGLPVAWVQPFVRGVDISGGMITGAFAITAEKDHLKLHATEPLHVAGLTAVRNGQVLVAEADLSLGADALLQDEELEVKISDLTLTTPAGDALTAQLAVTLPMQPDPTVTFATKYVADLPRLAAPWLPVGHLRAAGEADLTLGGGKLELRRLSADVTDAAGLTLFKTVALRPVAFDLATRQEANAGQGDVDLFRFTLGRVPLDQVPLNEPGSKLGGLVEEGEFVLTSNGEKLTLHATRPLKLAGVSLEQDSHPALTGLSVELSPVVELTGRSAVTARSGDIIVRNAAGATVASLKAEATRLPVVGQRGSLVFSLEVPALGAQPLFAGAQAVSAGRASGEIRVAVGATSQVEARMTVNGLVARDSEQTLPVANLSFRGVVQEDGRMTVQAPLLLDRAGQRSDLSFSLDLLPAGKGYAVDGRLTGEHVELADALAVLGVFRRPAAVGAVPGPPAPVSESGPAADSVPAWSRFNGQLVVDVKSVTRGDDWTMSGLAASLLIGPDRLSLQKLEATFGEKGRLAAKGEVNFSKGAQPYQGGGEFTLTEFDAGKLFKALEPGRPATIEGTFAVNGRFAGQGATLPELARQTRGTFELSSRQGIFRGLQRASSKVSVATKAVELGASVFGSIFGSDKVTKAAERVAGTAYFVDQLAQNMGEFTYDQLNLKLVRDETLSVELADISLVSPEIRLTGQGTVSHVAGKPLLEQPLTVSLAFSGRGRIEQLLGKLHLLDGARDELGYARTQTPILIGGSLAKPDPSGYFSKIASAKLSELLAPDN